MSKIGKRPATFEELHNLEFELVERADHLPDRLPDESEAQYRRRLTEALRAMGAVSRQIANQYQYLHNRRVDRLDQYLNS